MELKDSTELRGKLISFSEKCWLQWSTSVADKFSSSFRAKMGNLKNESVAVFRPVAELFVPEKGNGEDAVAITYLIMDCLSCAISGTCGATIDSEKVREELRLDIGTKVISLYKELREGQGEGQGQSQPQTVLQLILDVKFCQWFHLQLKEQADPPIKTLQGIIDPFDMDIVGEKLKAKLKRFLFETHVSLIEKIV